MLPPGEPISVRALEPGQEKLWAEVLESSNNGTLFHDLRFLAYHPEDRFERHSLVFWREGRPVALLPAFLSREAGRTVLVSPYGASVGGIVVPASVGTEAALALVSALQDYARQQGFAGIEMRVGPSVYLREPSDLLSFALSARGFALDRRWLTYVVELAPEARWAEVEARFSAGKRHDVRAAARKGLEARETGAVDSFWPLVDETYSRHGSPPTHTKAEVADLLARVPGRVRIFLAAHEGKDVAGVLVFLLNRVAAYTFYIVESEAGRKLCAPAFLVAHVARRLGAEGLRHLDLGPSASDRDMNEGVVFFKEGLGAQGFVRETWRWPA